MPADHVTISPKHRPWRDEAVLLWAVAWPLIVTNLLNVSVGIIDFKMVGTLGVSSIAAVGMARQVMMFIMVLMIAISGGGSVLVAHAYGARDSDQVSRIAAQIVVLMLAAALFLVMPVGYLLSRPLLILLGAEQSVVGLGTPYLHILFLGGAFTMLNFAVTGILLGIGKTQVSLVLLVVVNILNIGFNYIFIFGYGLIPAFGVPGAAMGTVLARFIGSLAGLWIIRSKRFPIQVQYHDFKTVDLPIFRKILYLGGPRSLQGIVRNFSRLITIRIISLLPLATRAVSAYSAGMQVRLISAFIGLAFMSASMSRVGQNMGAGKPDAAAKSGWISAGMATAFMSTLAVLFFLFPEMIMGFFTSDPDVISMGRIFFRVIAVSEPIMALAFALGGALRGGGDPISPFIYAAFSDIVVVILVGYVLAITLNMGFAGIAIGLAASAVTRAIPTSLKFRHGSWKRNQFYSKSDS